MEVLRFYLLTTMATLTLGSVAFSALEQGVAVAANSATVTARQQVTAEISMTVVTGAVEMLPPIPGSSGGIGDGFDQVSVITNNATGFSVTIQASTTGGLGAMKGETQGGYFGDYPTTVPQDWESSTAGQASRFGFGLMNLSLSSDNGAPNYGDCSGDEDCFAKLPTTTPVQIVNVSVPTPTLGDYFMLKFRAQIPANPNPLVPEDFYTATATITTTMN